MAKLSAHGPEMFRYFSPRRGFLKAYMSDGTILYRSVFTSGWKILGRVKPGVSVEQAVASARDWVSKQPVWLQQIRSLPSQRTLERWNADGGCETPSGDWVEPDGQGPNGEPSWLLLLGL